MLARSHAVADRPLVRPLIFTVIAVGALVLRNPSSLLRAEPAYEDGPVFIQGAFQLGGSLLQPFEGYLDVGPRLAAIAATLFPVRFWPLVMNGCAIAVTALVAAFIASDRLRSALPDRHVRMGIAIGFVLLPAAHEMSWHAVYIQWSLAVFLLFRSIADEPRRLIVLDRIAISIAALSGPVSVILAPLYVWRQRRAPLFIVLGAAAVQMMLLLTADRLPGTVETIDAAARIVAGRVLLVPLIGTHLFAWFATAGVPEWLALAFVVTVGGLLAFAATAFPRPALIAMLYACVSMAVIALIRMRDPVPDLLAGFDGSRYFLLAGVAVVAVVISAAIRGSPKQRTAAFLLLIPLSFGVLFDFSIPTNQAVGWETASRCIGGPAPCFVPDMGDRRWSVYWGGTS
jgi:hypothetical protein